MNLSAQCDFDNFVNKPVKFENPLVFASRSIQGSESVCGLPMTRETAAKYEGSTLIGGRGGNPWVGWRRGGRYI